MDSKVVGAGIVLIGLGTVFLLAELDVIGIKFQYVAPVLLILAGVGMLIAGAGSKPGWTKKEDTSSGDFASYRPRRPERDEV